MSWNSSKTAGLISGLLSGNAPLGYMMYRFWPVFQSIAGQSGAQSSGAAYPSDNDYIDKVMSSISSDREWNSAEAQKNRDFQERMANTQVQRSVKDIQAAGLNPWLAVQGSSALSGGSVSGSQAESNGSSAMASILSSSLNNNVKITDSLLKFVGQILNSAMKVMK